MFKNATNQASRPYGQLLGSWSGTASDNIFPPAASWSEAVEQLTTALGTIQATGADGQVLDVEEALAVLVNLTGTVRDNEGSIFFIGNGASASLAAHTAADLMKSGQVRCQVLSDPALMTASANDYSYEEVFSVPLARYFRGADMLAAISSSGESPNIVRACQLAHRRNIKLVTFSAMEANNRLRALGTLNFYFQADDYGLAECCHAAILHHWTDLATSSL